MTPAELFASLRRRYRLQKSLRTNIEQVWDEIDYYTGPVKAIGATAANPSGAGQGAGQEARKDLWDFTAIDSREKLAASMQASMVNPALRWIVMAWRTGMLNKDSESSKWLSERAEEAWGDIQDSDFNTEIGSFFHELSGPGHAFIGMEAMDPIAELVDGKIVEQWAGIDFTSIPLRESYFEQDRRGGLRTFWRRYTWSAGQVIDYCEDKDIAVPDEIVAAHNSGAANEYEIVCAFYLRPEIAKRKKVRYPAAPDKRPWGVMWWWEDKGIVLGEEGGYYEQPVFMCRWAKTAGSKWGHGPGNIALPTVKYINAKKEMVRTAGEKALDPTILSKDRNITSSVDHRPGGVVTCRDPQAVVVLESKANFQVAFEEIEQDRGEIRKIFHTDDLELKDSPAMTATEAQIRYEWMQRLLGKTTTFIQNDALGPIIENIVAMRVRLKASPPMPKAARAAGGIYNIEYQGPLARSMRTDEVAAIERGATFVAGLAQFYPRARAAFDPIKAIKYVFQRLGVPADIIPTDAEMKKAGDQIDAEMARAMAAEASAKEGQAAKAGAEAAAKGGPVAGAVYPPLPPVPQMNLAGEVA